MHKKKQMSVISALIPKVRKKGIIKLFKSHNKNFEDGKQMRDFVHVSDCVNMMIWLYKRPKISGIFNVGTGEARTFLDLAKIIFKNLKKIENIHFVNTPKNVLKHYQYFTKANMNKIRKLGYLKKFKKIEDGIKYQIKEENC